MKKTITRMHTEGKIEVQKQPTTIASSSARYFKRTFYKTYPRFLQIPLRVKRANANLEEIQSKRESCRKFDRTSSLSFEVLSSILYFSSGLRVKDSAHPLLPFYNGQIKRMHESGGALYPIEVYVVVRNVVGLDQGVYHYNVLDNTLEMVLNEPVEEMIVSALPNTVEWTRDASAYVLLTSIPCRQEIKYGSSAYPFSLKEAGAVGHALALHATKFDVGLCEIGAFDERILSQAIDLDSSEELMLSFIAIGIKTTPKRGE